MRHSEGYRLRRGWVDPIPIDSATMALADSGFYALPALNRALMEGSICEGDMEAWDLVRCWTECPVRAECEAEHRRLTDAVARTTGTRNGAVVPGVWGGIRYPDHEGMVRVPDDPDRCGECRRNPLARGLCSAHYNRRRRVLATNKD